MIEFTDVYKRYPNRHEALSGLSFKIDDGEMAFLTGHSGAGKSTLLKLIALIERSSHGQVIVNKQNLTHLPKRKVPYYRRQIGLVFQDHNLLHDDISHQNNSPYVKLINFPNCKSISSISHEKSVAIAVFLAEF